jgi:N-acyl homoserine lactone hydrolase
MSTAIVQRVDFGYFVRPAAETGTGAERLEPCLGYVINHTRRRVLVDTGMGSNPEVDAHYRPRRIELDAALNAVGLTLSDIDLVANCHLHFDHCGGNPLLGDIPVFVQAVELENARTTEDYTLPELIDRNRFERILGHAEILPGVYLIPTPGHTAGHQSVVVRQSDGAVVVAGQSQDSATQYAADQLAWRAHRDNDSPDTLPATPDWMDALQQFDPRRVYFAHDRSVWQP